MRAIVAGGAGFIGSHLVDELVRQDEKNKVWIIDDFRLGKISNVEHNISERVMFWDIDVVTSFVNNTGTINEFKPDIIFNLAVDPLTKSLNKPMEVWNNNVQATWAIAHYCMNTNTRMLHFSSSEVYGTAIKGIIDESHELYPTTPYAASKAACDHLINSLVETYGLDVVTIRPFNVIGPRQNDASYAGIIPLTIRQIQRGETPVIYGTGHQSRDYSYVTDIARATLTLASDGVRGRVYNACSGRETTVNWLVNQICKEMGYDGDITYEAKRVADVQRHIGDNKRLKDQTEWIPLVSIHEAIKKTVEWYNVVRSE